MDLKNLALIAINASLEAGREILKVYDSDFEVIAKPDQSPLTSADQKSHDSIVKQLSNTGFPILSEEGSQEDYKKRKKWDTLWVIDPLDGTKEFVKRNGEFTVNIALVQNGQAVLGVIYVPAKKTLYYAYEGTGACKVENIKPGEKVKSMEGINGRAQGLPIKQEGRAYTVVGSRSHMSEETRQYIDSLKKEHQKIEILSVGSSLKLCMVAEGKADVYPRFAPTMEWDTAAGHAIANMAGFEVQNYHTKNPLAYNKEDLLNPWFILN